MPEEILVDWKWFQHTLDNCITMGKYLNKEETKKIMQYIFLLTGANINVVEFTNTFLDAMEEFGT